MERYAARGRRATCLPLPFLDSFSSAYTDHAQRYNRDSTRPRPVFVVSAAGVESEGKGASRRPSA